MDMIFLASAAQAFGVSDLRCASQEHTDHSPLPIAFKSIPTASANEAPADSLRELSLVDAPSADGGVLEPVVFAGSGLTDAARGSTDVATAGEFILCRVPPGARGMWGTATDILLEFASLVVVGGNSQSGNKYGCGSRGLLYISGYMLKSLCSSILLCSMNLHFVGVSLRHGLTQPDWR